MGNTVGVRVPLRAREILAPYVPSTEGAKAFSAFGKRGGHCPLPAISASLVGSLAVAAALLSDSPRTTRRAGSAATWLPRRVGLRGAGVDRVSVMAASSPTTSSAGAAALLDARRVALRGDRVAVSAVAGSSPTSRSARSVTLPDGRTTSGVAALTAAGISPTTRSAGSGATVPITRRVRVRRAVSPSM